MSNIQVLDDLTIKKIAAGEVIENPASVVKELVENSIDANSQNITIEIKKGGKEYIRITDDGNGMSKEDLELAFKRHSTSKLRNINDIYNIFSLGFRGEALASISSVSKIKVLTKTEEFKVGNRAYIENGKVEKIEPVGTPKGTTMIIRDLFYNLPVRKKFLKKDSRESNYINNVINRLALGNPKISFTFIKDNKKLIQTDGKGNLKNTIYTILGRETAKNIVPIDYKDNYIEIKGYISNNQLYRGNRSHQYLYINGRYILNFAIRKAIENRYKTLLPVGRFPLYFLNISLNPKEIDVNIHPTKEEIKFVDPDRVIGTISNNVNKTIENSLEIPKIRGKKHKENNKNKDLPKLYEINTENLENRDVIKENNRDSNLTNTFAAKNSNFEKNREPYNPNFNNFNKKNLDIEAKDDNIINIEELDISDLFFDKSNDNLNDKLSTNESDLETQKSSSKIDYNLVESRIVGIVFNTYILLENKSAESIYLIDQHAAHERIMYEKYKNEFKKEKIVTQQLLVPEIINLNLEDMAIFDKNKNLFNNLGFDVELFGSDSVAIRGVPMLFGKPELENFFIEMLDNLNSGINSSYDLKVDKIMKVACVNAIKSGDILKDIEIKALLEDLLKCKNPYTCPHGRPTILELTKKELEEEFLRIM